MTSPNERFAAATKLVENNVMGSMAIGLIPVPAIDVAGLFVQQLYMLKALGEIYDQEFSADWSRKTIVAFMGGLVPTALFLPAASVLRVVPVVGNAVSLFTMPMLAGAATYALGKVFVDHFESGGTALTLNAGALREKFRGYYKEGRQIAASNGSNDRSATEQPRPNADSPGATPPGEPAITPEAESKPEANVSEDQQVDSSTQADIKPPETDSVAQVNEQASAVTAQSDHEAVRALQAGAIAGGDAAGESALASNAEAVAQDPLNTAGVATLASAVPDVVDKRNLRGVLTFNGADNFLQVQQSNVLCTTRNLTVEMWIKPDRFDTSPRLYSKAYGGEIETALGNDAKVYFHDGNAGGHAQPHQSFASRKSLAADVWYHVAFVRDLDSEEKTLTCYINGEKDNEALTQFPSPKVSGGNVFVGARLGTSAHRYKGQLAEIRTWTRARSAEEIRADMNRRLAGDEDGLLGYWCCDAGSGDIVRDKTANAYDMKIFGEPIWGTADVRTSGIEPVMQFDGKDDYIALPEMDVDYSHGYTIEAWVQHDSFPNWSRVIDFGNGAGVDSVIFAQAGTTGNLAVHVYRGGNKAGIETPAFNIGQWSHVAVVVDTAGMATLYKDGRLRKSQHMQLPANVKRTTNYIGRSNWQQDGYFHGKMSELRLWNRARTADEILRDMNDRLTGKEAGLVGCWPLNVMNDIGLTPDLTGQHHGLLRGASLADSVTIPITLHGKAPLAGAVLELDGTTESYVIFNPFKGFPSTDITAECWVKSDDRDKAGSLISYARSADNDFLLHDHRNLEPHIRQRAVKSNIAFNDGRWHHLALTWRSSDGALKVYKDGTLVFLGNLSFGAFFEDGGALVLGQDQDLVGGGFDAAQAYRGLLCDVRIWKRVRTADEILANMTRRLAGNETGLVGYWPLDEGEGSIARDKTSNGNDGTIHGAKWSTSESVAPPPIELRTGDVIALLADDGQYLSRINRGDKNPIEAAKDKADVYSQFKVTVLENRQIALEANNGQLLSRVNRGSTDPIESWNSTVANVHSLFTVTYLEEGKIALEASNGRYISRIRRSGGIDPIEAAKSSADIPSRFKVERVAATKPEKD